MINLKHYLLVWFFVLAAIGSTSYPKCAKIFDPKDESVVVDKSKYEFILNRWAKNMNTTISVMLTNRQYTVVKDKVSDDYNYGFVDFFENGTYHCVVWDEVLFDSRHKMKINKKIDLTFNHFNDTIGKLKLREIDIPVEAIQESYNLSDTIFTEMYWENWEGYTGDIYEDTPERGWRKGKRYIVNSSAVWFVPRSLEKYGGKQPEQDAFIMMNYTAFI